MVRCTPVRFTEMNFFVALIVAVAAASTDVMGVCAPLHRKTTARTTKQSKVSTRCAMSLDSGKKLSKTKGVHHHYTKAKDNSGKSKLRGEMMADILSDTDLYLADPNATIYSHRSNSLIASLRALTVKSESASTNKEVEGSIIEA